MISFSSVVTFTPPGDSGLTYLSVQLAIARILA